MNNSSSDRIVRELRAWISSSAPGAQLPPTRELVSQFRASPVTVQKALSRLTQSGLIDTQPGVGTFVRGQRAAKAADYGWQTSTLGIPARRVPAMSTALKSVPYESMELHSGYPDRSLLAERLVHQAFIRAARSDAAVARPPSAGLPELQAWCAAELAAQMSTSLSAPNPADVIVFPGSQSALGLLFRALTHGRETLPGVASLSGKRPQASPEGQQPIILMESPTYWGAISAAAQVGVEVVPVPSGPQGIDLVALENALKRTGAKAIYAQPNFTNPTGTQWTPDTVDGVLDLIRAHNAFLIEDDWARDFGIESESMPVAARNDDGHVIYLRSFTKSISTAVRVATVIARGPVRQRILADVQAEAMYVSGILQRVAVDVVTQPAWRTHVKSLRHTLRTRRDLLRDAIATHLPDAHIDHVPQGGLNLWVRFPEGTQVHELAQYAEQRSVIIASGDEWFPAEPTAPYVRLNFSGPNPGSYPDAMRVLGEYFNRM
ncbi:PLP-dependent aminotransferase family protein [Haematomicrobium sanguinis]|uniref:aminotransferase-like domain-containing protein n=1 Tax=Haematomicrobium sanguinis TaxID=479106 RepID=UPI0005548380|nr:PLP-dependent aminotransferase family protein [Haematomicrobium sanguinis]